MSSKPARQAQAVRLERRSGVTRREFLRGSSMLAASPVAVALAQSDNTIQVRAISTGSAVAAIEVTHRGASWTLERDWLGAAGTLTITSDKPVPDANADTAPTWILVDGDTLHIDIEQYVFAGTDLGWAFRLTLHFVQGHATISLDLPTFRVSNSIELHDWFSGAAELSGALSERQAQTIAKGLDHRSISAAGKATLSLNNTGAFALAGRETAVQFLVNDVSVPVDRLIFAVRRWDDPHKVAADRLLDEENNRIPGYAASPYVTRCWAHALAGEAGGRVGATARLEANLHNIAVRDVNLAENAIETPISLVLADLSAESKTCVIAKTISLRSDVSFTAREAADEEHASQYPVFTLVAAELKQLVWGEVSHTWLDGRFDAKPQLQPRGHVPLTTSGTPTPTPAVTGNPPTDFHLRCDRKTIYAFEATAGLHHAFVPMLGADYSRIDFEGTAIKFLLQELAASSLASDLAAVYVIAFPPIFGAVLGKRAIVRATRAADLLALKFGFRDIYLTATPRGATIDACSKVIAPQVSLAHEDPPLMIVRFPPQHIAERAYLQLPAKTSAAVKPRVAIGEHRVYDAPGGTYGRLTEVQAKLGGETPEVVGAKNRRLARADRDPDASPGSALLEGLEHVAEARMAGPTRLVFAFERETPPREGEAVAPLLPRPYAVDRLTDWSHLKARVGTRALRRDALVADQLAVAGIPPRTPVGNKLKAIRESLRSLDDTDTAIEFPYRLQLSPSDDARWLTPQPSGKDRTALGVPLWSARLDPDYGGRSVRAVWAAEFRRASENFFAGGAHPKHSNAAPWLANPPRFWPDWSAKRAFRTSVDERDRYEFVLLSSVYGLPSLLPVPDPNLMNPVDKDKQRAESTVVPLPAPYVAVDGPLGREGVYSPQPLTQAHMALSSLGATVDLQGQWDPPSGFTLDALNPQPLWAALTVERWQHKAFLGRDVFVEVVYKGFLFPFGHRCSVVKATERKFVADPNDLNGRSPVAYLVQRYFIVIGEKDKTFPAVSQRYAGRAFYATTVTMRTTTTPDIVDPYENDLENLDPNSTSGTRFGKLGGYAFFPKTRNGKDFNGLIEFEYDVTYSDGQSRRLKGPLLVVDNTLAHDPLGIEALVKYYNREPHPSDPSLGLPRDARRADAAGLRLRYAEELRAGSAEFATDHLLLGALGRDGPDIVTPENAAKYDYTMDAVMEGADQPPFYPNITETLIEVQSLNYMNGASQGYVPATYALNYLENGFSPAQNPSGIFFSLLDKDGKRSDLSLDKKSSSSGGLATPNMKMVALSRERGPVGGTNAPKTLDASGTSFRTSSVSGGVSLELTQSEKGQFDPLEALSGALADAKLFGIIPMKSVLPVLRFIEGAPDMVESTVYNLFGTPQEFANKAAGVAATVREVIGDARVEANTTLAEYSTKIGLDQANGLVFADLYPRLDGAISAVERALDELVAVAPDFVNNPGPGLNALGKSASTIKALLAEVKAVAHHPTPAIVDKLIARFNELLKSIGPALKALLDDALGALVDELVGNLKVEYTLKFTSDPGSDTLKIVLDTDGNVPDTVLFDMVATVLSGRSDNAVQVGKPDDDGTRHWAMTVGFDLTKMAVVDQNMLVIDQDKAIDAVEDRLLAEALLHAEVVQPLLDGYLAVDQLIKTVAAQKAEVERQLHELPGLLTNALASWIDGVLGLGRLIEMNKQFIDLANTASSGLKQILVDTCADYIDPIVDDVSAVAGKVAVRAARLDEELVKVLAQTDKITAAKAINEDYRNRISRGRAKLAKSKEQLGAAIADFNAIGKELGTKPSVRLALALGADLDFDKLNPLAQVLAKFLNIRAILLARVYDTLDAAAQLVGDGLDAVVPNRAPASASGSRAAPTDADNDKRILVGSAATVARELLDLVKDLVADLSGSTPTTNAKIKNIHNTFDKKKDALEAGFADLKKNANTVRVASTSARDAIDLALNVNEPDKALPHLRTFMASAGAVLHQLGGDERKISGLVMRGITMGQDALDKVDAKFYPIFKTAALKGLQLLVGDEMQLGIYGLTTTAVEQLNPDDWLKGDTETILKLFLSDKLFDALKLLQTSGEIRQQLKTEADTFRAVWNELKDGTKTTYQSLTTTKPLNALLQSWSADRRPAPLLALQPIGDLADLLLKGKVSDLIDLTKLDRALEQLLLSFVPDQISFDYEWGVPLKPFPSESSKIFWIDHDAPPPRDGYDVSPAFKDKVRKKGSDLTIYTRAGVSFKDGLDRPKPIFQAEGDIRNPAIRLFGPSFDVVTVRFDQIRFLADASGSEFKVKLRSAPGIPIEFGSMMQYVQALSKILGGDSGPYVELAFNPLGVIAGYRYSADILMIGTLALVNFSIDISLQLSFDNTPLQVRVALAARNRPMLLVCMPYGGAGYLALRTVATDIVGFEMQFEFGGAVAIRFGPLNAYGFVSAGIYIEKSKGQALIIAGFVRAIGEGTIACFSIAVHFEVRITQQGSNVTGTATFSFTFKVGIVKIKLSFTAAYQFAGKSGGGSGALLTGDYYDKWTYAAKVADRRREWKTYKRYFQKVSL